MPVADHDEHDEYATQWETGPSPATRAASSAFPTVPGYEILAEIGRGGMGVVYRARQIRANREVALKMIVSGDHAGSEDIARFRIEAEAVARLQHPNIVAVFEVGEHAGLPFFSMEHCADGSLALIADKPLAPLEACAIMLKVARGASAAHVAGIVHRDLKPQNVLLAADGTPKISDFGLAKRLCSSDAERSSGLTQTGAVLGTPSYMAPEQAFGDSRHVGPESDVYSLGAMLYALLVGRPPFVGPTPIDTMLKAISEDPERPQSLRREIPQDLDVVCMKCLEKDRRKRYRSAHELAEDLSRILEGEPVSVMRSGLLGRVVGAMDRVQLNERFASYGTMLLLLAPVMLVPEILVAVVCWNRWPGPILLIFQFGRIAAFVALLGWCRKGRWLPQGPAERHLWMVWGGYLLCCFAAAFSHRLVTDLHSAEAELPLYLDFASLTALAFFAMAAMYWGYCAVIAFGFLALTMVMAIDLRFAPIEFGAAWATVLVVLGARLRALSKTEGGGAGRVS